MYFLSPDITIFLFVIHPHLPPSSLHPFQRPLVRLARELQRLSSSFRRCTRHDVTSGLRVLLSASLFASATRACVKAITLAKLEGTSLKKSKQTLAGLQVGDNFMCVIHSFIHSFIFLLIH